VSRSERFLGWLENTSDWLSPIVVKEVRQVVRGREFAYSFAASLVAGLAVAFFGAADALTGTGTAGRWTFAVLMGCLALLGLAVVPLGAFSALRLERMEQTLELITLTALTARRVVIGKLLAQGVKLATLFAGMAPFIAMSFLLGGIDFATILLALIVLFMWSLWLSAACLFLSSLLKTRAMVGLVFGGAAIVLLVIFVLGRILFFVATRGGFAGSRAFGLSLTASAPWWALAIMTTLCLASMANLVLLAESRLSLPTENRVTPLRLGFLVQFLLIVGWTVSFLGEPPPSRYAALDALGVFGGLHLAIVAMFTVTEDLIVPRRALLAAAGSRWQWLLAMFRPGGGRGAIYVLAQMAILLVAAWLLQPTWLQFRWFLAACGYICVFTGVPVFAFRYLRPERSASLQLRVAVLLLLPLAMTLPDIIHYVVWRPDVLSLSFSARHLLNPIRALANWPLVEARAWLPLPFALGAVGLLTYAALIHLGASVTAEVAAGPQASATQAEEPGRADVLY
jgi:hypothetical protein